MPACYWRGATKAQERVWSGFARVESLAWWLAKGGELVDIPALRFAERSRRSGLLVWDAMPPGQVIRGLALEENGKPHLKVVTRESSDAELARYEHDRMPLLEAPLFQGDMVSGLPRMPFRPQQQDLF